MRMDTKCNMLTDTGFETFYFSVNNEDVQNCWRLWVGFKALSAGVVSLTVKGLAFLMAG